MNLSEAFEHFLEHIAKKTNTKGTVASWKNRFNKNELSYEKMQELLIDAGYKCFRSEEDWLLPDQDKPYEFVVLDKNEIVKYVQISAISKRDATKQIKVEHYVLLNDLSNKEIIQAIAKLLYVLQNS